MAWSTVERALDTVFRSPSDDLWIGFYGGEPLLAFDLVERTVEAAERRRPRDRELRFHVSTNGLLLDERKGSFLAAHEVETQISFDGSREAQNLRAPGTYHRISERLRRLRRMLPDYYSRLVKVAVTVTPAAVPTLASAVDELTGSGIESVDLAPAMLGAAGWTAGDEGELERQMDRICESALRLYEHTGRVPVTLFRRGPGRVVSTGNGQMCGLTRPGTLTVDVDGEVNGCTTLARSYQTLSLPGLKRWVAPLRIGPVDAPDLEARVQSFRSSVERSALFGEREKKHSAHGRCRECRYRGECLICPAAIARAGEDPHRVPDYLCAFSRVSLSYRERFPAQILSSPRP
jgi:sulfatase maturation enzyme AslB (radical SAM superfamily)